MTDFLIDMREAFVRGSEASPTGVNRGDFLFAGLPVRVNAASPRLLEQFRRTFKPLAVDDAEVPFALTINAWDRSSTGVGCPGIRFEPDTSAPVDAGILTQYGGGSVLRHEQAIAVSALDRRRRELFFWVEDAEERELASLSKPFPHLLGVWYQDRSIHQLHSGLISEQGRGLLLAGQGGSGKTTCTLACALAGFDYLGDDHVGIELVDGASVGHSFYDSARLDDATLVRFPEIGARALAPRHSWEVKNLVFMSDVMSRIARGEMIARTEIRALVVPQIVPEGPARLTPMRAVEAMRRLAPSTLFVPLGGGSQGFRAMGELVRRVPCYRLAVGPDVREVPDRLRSLVETG